MSPAPIGSAAELEKRTTDLTDCMRQKRVEILDQLGDGQSLLKHLMATCATFPGSPRIETQRHPLNRHKRLGPQFWSWATFIHEIVWTRRDVDERKGHFDLEMGGGSSGRAHDNAIVNCAVESMNETMLSFYEKFERYLITENTFPLPTLSTETAATAQQVGSISGISALISKVDHPTSTSCIGGIDYSLEENAYWRNISKTGVTLETLEDTFGDVERKVRRRGGRPSLYIAGGVFIDNLKQFAASAADRRQVAHKMRVTVCPPGNDVMINGNKVVWCHAFDDLDAANHSASSTVDKLSKTMFAIDLCHLQLRFHERFGEPTPYNYISERNNEDWCQGMKTSFGLTCDRRDVHYRLEMT